MKRGSFESIAKQGNVLFVCFGTTYEDELPQVVTEDDVVIDLFSHINGKTRNRADAELHHQVEPDS